MACVTACYDAAPAPRTAADILPRDASEHAERKKGPAAKNRHMDASLEHSTATIEPPVPASLAHLTCPQQALADLLHVDPHLLTAAARASGAAPSQAIDKDALAAWIRALPPHAKDTLLLDAAPQPGPVLLARHAPRPTARPNRPPPPDAAQPRSSSTPPTRCAASSPGSRNRPAPAPAPAEPNSRLTRATWTAWPRTPSEPGRTSPNLIEQKQPGPYDAAVTLLKDLREVHDRAGTPEEFARRLHDLREQHRGKPSLMRRLTDASLTTR